MAFGLVEQVLLVGAVGDRAAVDHLPSPAALAVEQVLEDRPHGLVLLHVIAIGEGVAEDQDATGPGRLGVIALRAAQALRVELERDLELRTPHGPPGAGRLVPSQHVVVPAEGQGRGLALRRREAGVDPQAGGAFDHQRPDEEGSRGEARVGEDGPRAAHRAVP